MTVHDVPDTLVALRRKELLPRPFLQLIVVRREQCSEFHESFGEVDTVRLQTEPRKRKFIGEIETADPIP